MSNGRDEAYPLNFPEKRFDCVFITLKSVTRVLARSFKVSLVGVSTKYYGNVVAL